MRQFWARLRAIDDTLQGVPRRKAYSVVLLLVLLLLVYGARPGGLGRSGWHGPGGEVLAYVRCGWDNRITIHLNPELTGEERELAIVHENAHVVDARRAGSCFVFNLTGRLSAQIRLEREARAHCAELEHRLARYMRASPDVPETERLRRLERGLQYGQKRILINLMSADAYSTIANLGRPTVEASVRDACAFPEARTASAKARSS